MDPTKDLHPNTTITKEQPNPTVTEEEQVANITKEQQDAKITKEQQDVKIMKAQHNADSKLLESQQKPANTTVTTSTLPRPNPSTDPPIYYDSEPSSQPPIYPIPSTPSSKPTSPIPLQHLSSNPSSRYTHGTQTPASTINAILGNPGVDIDAQRRAERKNKSLRERWRGFMERNFSQREDNPGEEKDWSGRGGSAAQWNVWGSRVGGGLTNPYEKKSGR